MTTVIIEPHSDDAWLSLGQHFIDRAFGPVAILTVYGDDKRMAEAEKYATTVASGRWRGLGLPEGGEGNGKEWITDPPPLDLLADAVDSLKPGRIIVPLGIQHPEHEAVRDAADMIWGKQADYYVELPYALLRKNSTTLVGLVDELEVPLMSLRTRTAAANAAAHIFQSQSLFWHYNREKMVGAMEIIMGLNG